MPSSSVATKSEPQTLLQEVLELAQKIRVLTEAQRQKIQTLAPQMDTAKLTELKTQLEQIRDADLKDMKQELAAKQSVAAAYLEWSTQKARSARQTAEAVQAASDAQAAENILNF